MGVRWYLRYGLSSRDVEELLAELGVDVDHMTVYRSGPSSAPPVGTLLSLLLPRPEVGMRSGRPSGELLAALTVVVSTVISFLVEITSTGNPSLLAVIGLVLTVVLAAWLASLLHSAEAGRRSTDRADGSGRESPPAPRTESSPSRRAPAPDQAPTGTAARGASRPLLPRIGMTGVGRLLDLDWPVAVLLGTGSLLWLIAQYLPWHLNGYGSLVLLGPFAAQNLAYFVLLGQAIVFGTAATRARRASVGAFVLGGSGWILAWPVMVLTRLSEVRGPAVVEIVFAASAVVLVLGMLLGCVTFLRRVRWRRRRDLSAVLAGGAVLAGAAVIAGYDAELRPVRYVACSAVAAIVAAIAAQSTNRKAGSAALCGWIGYAVLDRVGWLVALALAGQWGGIYHERFSVYAGGLFDEGNVVDFSLEWIGPLTLLVALLAVVALRQARTARTARSQMHKDQPAFTNGPLSSLLLAACGVAVLAQIVSAAAVPGSANIEAGPFLVGNIDLFVLAGLACALLVAPERQSVRLAALVAGGAGWLLAYPMLNAESTLRSGAAGGVIAAALLAVATMLAGLGMAAATVHRALGRPSQASLAVMGSAVACAVGLHVSLRDGADGEFVELALVAAATASIGLAVASSRRRAAALLLVGWVGFALIEQFGFRLSGTLTESNNPYSFGYDDSFLSAPPALAGCILLMTVVAAWIRWAPMRIQQGHRLPVSANVVPETQS